ncbi:60S ribosomal protein L23, putative [Medicago truncatula]|uniref:60S ribosomal protein L23, putative n=1 Tax=Medicago truncatula TaxID=3880 RepID=A0A072UKQ6_MEDTR|nr:60S ribosomal protein L23, putative [Medicago truncatula]
MIVAISRHDLMQSMWPQLLSRCGFGSSRSSDSTTSFANKASTPAISASTALTFNNSGVIVNPKGEMKDQLIDKEYADLWPRIASAANAIA